MRHRPEQHRAVARVALKTVPQTTHSRFMAAADCSSFSGPRSLGRATVPERAEETVVTSVCGAVTGIMSVLHASPLKLQDRCGFEPRRLNPLAAAGIAGASTASGAAAGQYNCDQNPNQRWSERAAGDAVNFVNGKSSLCLGVAGGSTADAAEIGQYNCDPPNPNTNQAWRFKPLSAGFFQIVNGKSGKCIGVGGGSTANGASLMQFPCETSGAIDNQSWMYVD